MYFRVKLTFLVKLSYLRLEIVYNLINLMSDVWHHCDRDVRFSFRLSFCMSAIF